MRLKDPYRTCRCLPIALVAFFLLSAAASWPQEAPPAASQLSANQIVAEMQLHDRMRRQTLLHYESLRHYAVVYHGFFRTLKAAMDVQVTYDAHAGKSLRIVSQSGSGLLRSEVLKRGVDSEEEAAREPRATELSTHNYSFKLLGSEAVNGRPAYILYAHPLSRGKFLYDGKIWVDAADFALVRIEARPAKNPSFWISHTDIDEEYEQVQGFWLPRSNRSTTKVRIGGTAVFTIDYGTYTAVVRKPQASTAK